MTNDPLFIEMFDESETHSGPGAVPAQSPLDRELFAFEASNGTAELLAAKLMQRAFTEELLGVDDLAKRVRATVYDTSPPISPIGPPIDISTFEQEPLLTPNEADDVRLCECKCQRCEKDDCQHCEAEKKCSRHSSPSHATDAHKAAIARMVGEFRSRLYLQQVETGKLERAMLRYVRKAVAQI